MAILLHETATAKYILYSNANSWEICCCQNESNLVWIFEFYAFLKCNILQHYYHIVCIYSLLERWRFLLPRKVSITVRFSSPQQQAMHATENRLTRISLAIVWMFIFCHIWKLIPTVYEAITAEEVSRVFIICIVQSFLDRFFLHIFLNFMRASFFEFFKKQC